MNWRALFIELESSAIQLERSLVQLESSSVQLDHYLIELESSLINWVYVFRRSIYTSKQR